MSVDFTNTSIKLGAIKLGVGTIDTETIADKAVDAYKIDDNAVTTAKIRDGEVTNSKLAANAVTTAKIRDGEVTNSKLAANAVTTAKIRDGEVTNSKLAANAVTTAKIRDGEVTNSKLAANAVTTAKIRDGEVTNSKLAANAVTSDKIDHGAVTTANIANNAVTANKFTPDLKSKLDQLPESTPDITPFTLVLDASQSGWQGDDDDTIKNWWNEQKGKAHYDSSFFLDPSSEKYRGYYAFTAGKAATLRATLGGAAGHERVSGNTAPSSFGTHGPPGRLIQATFSINKGDRIVFFGGKRNGTGGGGASCLMLFNDGSNNASLLGRKNYVNGFVPLVIAAGGSTGTNIRSGSLFTSAAQPLSTTMSSTSNYFDEAIGSTRTNLFSTSSTDTATVNFMTNIYRRGICKGGIGGPFNAHLSTGGAGWNSGPVQYDGREAATDTSSALAFGAEGVSAQNPKATNRMGGFGGGGGDGDDGHSQTSNICAAGGGYFGGCKQWNPLPSSLLSSPPDPSILYYAAYATSSYHRKDYETNVLAANQLGPLSYVDDTALEYHDAGYNFSNGYIPGTVQGTGHNIVRAGGASPSGGKVILEFFTALSSPLLGPIIPLRINPVIPYITPFTLVLDASQSGWQGDDDDTIKNWWNEQKGKAHYDSSFFLDPSSEKYRGYYAFTAGKAATLRATLGGAAGHERVSGNTAPSSFGTHGPPGRLIQATFSINKGDRIVFFGGKRNGTGGGGASCLMLFNDGSNASLLGRKNYVNGFVPLVIAAGGSTGTNIRSGSLFTSAAQPLSTTMSSTSNYFDEAIGSTRTNLFSTSSTDTATVNFMTNIYRRGICKGGIGGPFNAHLSTGGAGWNSGPVQYDGREAATDTSSALAFGAEGVSAQNPKATNRMGGFGGGGGDAADGHSQTSNICAAGGGYFGGCKQWNPLPSSLLSSPPDPSILYYAAYATSSYHRKDYETNVLAANQLGPLSYVDDTALEYHDAGYNFSNGYIPGTVQGTGHNIVRAGGASPSGGTVILEFFPPLPLV